ncbi:MAG: hypothetical protein IPH26_09875 [Sterolibacteriaceae bacterium]|uniref:Uncharacterized protein n=1 Tax=Candidatus Methylophosphatis roskildensis TaxID=2899263 RepID=A0A9D7E3T7_9PROT|nr:hypothetical protein [Candidatus Methylophosphatis roskildensis]MBK7238196.1 hypothetical protein [Sterolibacteriaceae bacterium]
MLKIAQVVGNTFMGSQIYTDGKWYPVSGVLGADDVLKLQGAGFTWDMKRIIGGTVSSPNCNAAIATDSQSLKKVALNIEPPKHENPTDKLDLWSAGQGNLALLHVLGLERDKIRSDPKKSHFPNDACYYGAISAAFSQTAQASVIEPLNELAVEITTTGLGNMPTESPVADALMKFVLDVGAAYFKKNDLNVAIARSVVERTIGYILPILAAKDPDNPPESLASMTEKLSAYDVRKLIDEEGVVTRASSGTNRNSKDYKSKSAPLTSSTIKWYFSPTSHYLSAYITADCGPANNGLYLVRFKIEESLGFGRSPVADTVEILSLGTK